MASPTINQVLRCSEWINTEVNARNLSDRRQKLIANLREKVEEFFKYRTLTII